MGRPAYKFRPIVRSGPRKGKRDAVWQFVLDHSTPRVGGWHCQFFWKNKKDFDGRVQARKFGLHRLDSINEEWQEVQRKNEEFQKAKSDLGQAKRRIEILESELNGMQDRPWKRLIVKHLFKIK